MCFLYTIQRHLGSLDPDAPLVYDKDTDVAIDYATYHIVIGRGESCTDPANKVQYERKYRSVETLSLAKISAAMVAAPGSRFVEFRNVDFGAGKPSAYYICLQTLLENGCVWGLKFDACINLNRGQTSILPLLTKHGQDLARLEFVNYNDASGFDITNWCKDNLGSFKQLNTFEYAGKYQRAPLAACLPPYCVMPSHTQ